MRSIRWLWVMVVVAGCYAEQGDEGVPVDELKGPPPLAPVPTYEAPDLGVFDADKLLELEKSGLALDRVLGARGPSEADLAASEPYKTISATLANDATEALRQFAPALPMLYPAKLEETAGRTFPAEWLRATNATFVLVAVVNRMDKYYRNSSTCGETRLIYRPRYTQPVMSARLPLTLNVVFDNIKSAGGCASLAQSWIDRARTNAAADYMGGPLRSLGAPVRIETNLLRYQASMFREPVSGGHFDYALRAFDLKGGQVAPMPLENTPREDLSATEADALRDYIRAHLPEVESGTLKIPDRFTTTRARSSAPYGLAIAANRPFAKYLGTEGEKLGAVDLSRFPSLASPSALVRRLDTMSCGGCHTTRSLAGFHVVGRESNDDPSVGDVGAIEVGVSPHWIESVPSRRATLLSLSKNVIGAVFEPFAEHPVGTPGDVGNHCGLGDAGFAKWTCKTGLKCVRLLEKHVGTCMHDTPYRGDACEVADVVPAGDPATTSMCDSSYTRDFVPFCESLKRLFEFPGLATPRFEDRKGLGCNNNGYQNGQYASGRAMEILTGSWLFGKKSNVGSGDNDSIVVPSRRQSIELVTIDDSMGYGALDTFVTRLYQPNSRFFKNHGKASQEKKGATEVEVMPRCDASHLCRDGFVCTRAIGASVGHGTCNPTYQMPSLQLLFHRMR